MSARQSFDLDGSSVAAEDSHPILFQENSSYRPPGGGASIPLSQESSSITAAPLDYALVEPKPTENDMKEITGLLKVRTSMLAMGACERAKRLARAYPQEVCICSPIVSELISIVEQDDSSQLAGGALSALSTLALYPSGRQQIIILGGAPPLVKLVANPDANRSNVVRAVQLIMNLAADTHNRRVIREEGGVEALVSLMKTAPLDSTMEQCMGALHNTMLTDSKAKNRAVEAGVASGLARVLGSKLDEGHTLSVRCKMLIADLLRIQDMQQLIVEAAKEMNIRIPGLTPLNKRTTNSSGGGFGTPTRASMVGELSRLSVADSAVGVGGLLGKVLSARITDSEAGIQVEADVA